MAAVETFVVAMALVAQAGDVAHRPSHGPPEVFDKNHHPMAAVQRPLGLAVGMGEGTLGYDFARTSDGGEHTIDVGVQLGIGEELEAGIDISVGPAAERQVQDVLGNVQLQLTRALDLRVEGGISRGLGATGTVAGVGLPFKWRLGPRFALVSGDRLSGISEESIFRIQLVERGGRQERRASLLLPLGLIAQLHERVALGVRTGYRVGFLDASGTQFPTSADLVVSPDRTWDLGVSTELFGSLDPALADEVGPNPSSFLAWTSLRF